ncbi:serine/threonine-protein kinase ULK4-like isoform X2 [Clavelina lepadiformis]|uniref:Protein kinase domain-containing protein n=1 Tax=Clavelina lepadiformis TaxID=159417 RepID=A0ABP0GZ23_CLALP
MNDGCFEKIYYCNIKAEHSMENFILYEEIGRGTNSIVYKGRRKGTIKFLTILCIEKEERAAITNWVRLVHEIEHENIVKFYEWYETSNHLWMVVELCTGGTLEEVLNFDKYLPEETVCNFGKDILSGLHYLHKHGIVFADLSLRKVLLDGPGNLKLTNFCTSRLVDENLKEIYMQATPEEIKDEIKYNDLKGLLEYQAPEVLKGGEPSMQSDIWALGVLLYHLYTGSLPFECQNAAQLMQQLLKSSYDTADIRNKIGLHYRQVNNGLSPAKPSDDFIDLLHQIFQKNPEKRPTAEELLQHPFWKDLMKLNTQVKPSLKNKPVRSNLNETSGGGDTRRVSAKSRSTKSAVKRVGSGDGTPRHKAPESVNVLDSTFTLSSRPHTASFCARQPDEMNDRKVTSRPTTPSSLLQTHSISKSQSEISNKSYVRNQSVVVSPHKSDDLKSSIYTEIPEELEQPTIQPLQDVAELIYHDSDLELCIIQDNPQVKKVEPFKWDPKSLPFQALLSVDRVTSEEMYSHLKQVLQALLQPSSTSQLRSKSNVMSYLGQLCTSSCAVANFIINSQILSQLASLLKSCIQQSPDISSKAARVIGIAASCATELEICTRICDTFTTLTEALRENFRNVRAKLSLVPAIGQLLYLVSEQEEGGANNLTADEQRPPSQQRTNWCIPHVTYSLLTRCLREGEDAIVQHYVCKTIEAVTTTNSQHGKRFVTASSQGSSGNVSSHNDIVGPQLWTVSCRATNENLKHASLSAMCRLNRLTGTGSVLQTVIDRIGLPTVLSTLTRASFKCQQALVTSLIETLYSAPKGQATRLAHGKDLVPSLMRLLDSPSAMVRAKVILALFLLLKRDSSLLTIACNNRLVMYIERESRKILPSTPFRQNVSMPSNTEYIQSCLNLLIQHVARQTPSIAASCITILDETIVRKHPSSNQVKQLRQILPTCLILQHFVTSQVFRSQVVASDFIIQLGLLLSHAILFLKKSPQSSAITSSVGEEIIRKFVDTVLAIVECLSQHPLVLTQHADSSMNSLVPHLIMLLGVYGNTDSQAICVKLLSDVLGTLLHFRAINIEQSIPESPLQTPPSRGSSLSSRHSRFRPRPDIPDEYGIQEIITINLIPEFQSFLTARNPLPTHGIRLLGILLEHWPSLTTSLFSHGLVPVLLSLFEKLQLSSQSYAAGLIMVLSYFIQTDNENIAKKMYENGLIDYVSSYLIKVHGQYGTIQGGLADDNLNIDAESLSEELGQMLGLLKSMLDRVTIYVKQALQTQNSTSASTNSARSLKAQTENAEQLLIIHKPLTELQGLCVQLLSAEQELADQALGCLSMMVQLYGGDHPDTMKPDNMNCLAHVLSNSTPKTQRIILKLIRRVITLNKNHSEKLASPAGRFLVNSVESVLSKAEKRADSSVSTLSNEILRCIFPSTDK